MIELLLLVKDTKFESKSQPQYNIKYNDGDCFYWSKIQNLKANHNYQRFAYIQTIIAFTGQRYKIWKQITTLTLLYYLTRKLLLLVKDTKFESKSQLIGVYHCCPQDCFYWSKIQNLKANHNIITHHCATLNIAFTGQRYKIWKQITTDNNI